MSMLARRALTQAGRRHCSFIARAKASNDSQVLLGPFKSVDSRFDSSLDGTLVTTKIGPDGVECELTVSRELSNNFGTLHGGTTALLVDVVGTLALLGRDPKRPGVSVEMNQSFLAAAREGERLTIAGSVLKYGRTLGFTEVTISSADQPGRLIAIGRHTKFLDL